MGAQKSNEMSYSATGPNRLSYWAKVPSYRSALQPYHSRSLRTLLASATSRPSSSPSPSRSKFEYHRSLDPELREIRLIHLLPRSHPANREAPAVRCRIEYASLNDNPVYLALSYVWGDPSVTRPILVDDSVFEATTNLADALEHLQHERRSLVLWVDAICINQNEEAGTETDKQTKDTEKDTQIQQMGDIYRHAAWVLAWLGSAADESDSAMESLDRLGKKCIFGMPRDDSFYLRRRQFVSTFLSSDATPAFSLPPVFELFRRPWWKRVWCLQEVELAKDVLILCGDFGMPIGVLQNAFAAINDFGAQIGLGDPLTEVARTIRVELGSRPPRILGAAAAGPGRVNRMERLEPLKKRIESSNGMGATDPRDHVFALLALASDAKELGIFSSQSKLCATVFAEVASSLIISKADLQILSWCEFIRRQQENLPSWVPDWSTLFSPTIWNNRDVLFSASGQTSVSVSVRTDGFERVLTVAGTRFDTIRRIGKSWCNEERRGFAPRDCLVEIIGFSSPSEGPYVTDDDRREAM